MKCPNCSNSQLIYDTRDIPYTYKGESTTIPKVTGHFCSSCDEIILDVEESKCLNQLMQAFNREVNQASINPQFIADVRKKLSLNQKQAAEMFGGGVNAFSRYENGQTKPPLALVILLKLLNQKPELLHDIDSLLVKNAKHHRNKHRRY